MMAVLPCQNAEVDAPSSSQQQQKAMVTDLTDSEEELDRQRDEVVKKASRCSLLGGVDANLLDDNSLSDDEVDLESLAAIEAAKAMANNNKKEMERMHEIPQPNQQSPRRCVSEGRRVRRSFSLDGSQNFGDRNSWGGGYGSKARRGKKPDFRWDKLNKGQSQSATNNNNDDDDAANNNNNNNKDQMPQPPVRWDDPTTLARADSSPTRTSAAVKATVSPRPQIRPTRKPVRRTKSFDVRKFYSNNDGGEEKLKRSRPTIQRTDSKVRFCMETEVFEVPRCTKDMKPDLYYTKKEIKVFKAEKKEEKRELKQQKKLEKEKLKAEAAAARAGSSEEEQKPTAEATASSSSSSEEAKQEEEEKPLEQRQEEPDPPAATSVTSSSSTTFSSSGLTLDEKFAKFNAKEERKKKKLEGATKPLTLDQKIEKLQAKEKGGNTMVTATTTSTIASC